MGHGNFSCTKADYYLGGKKAHRQEAQRPLAEIYLLKHPWPYAATYLNPFTSSVKQEYIFPTSWLLYSLS